MKSIRIITTNPTLYEKLSFLTTGKNVKLTYNEAKYIDRILKNINSKETIVKKLIKNNEIYLIKVNNAKFNIFFKSK